MPQGITGGPWSKISNSYHAYMALRQNNIWEIEDSVSSWMALR